MKNIFFQNCIAICIVLFISLLPTHVYGIDKINTEVLIALDWGDKEGEFGIEKKGKTPDGYSMDFIKTEDSFYILDPMNNRIHEYDLDGEFKRFIHLDWSWEDMGIPWKVTLYKNNFYMLIAKYSSFQSIRKIHKFSYDGQFLKIITVPSKEKLIEYTEISSDTNNGYIYLDGNYYVTPKDNPKGYPYIYKVLALDENGKLIDTIVEKKGEKFVSLVNVTAGGSPVIYWADRNVDDIHTMERHTMVLDVKTKKIIKEVKDTRHYSLVDKDGIFYRIRSGRKSSGNGERAITTKIYILDSKTNAGKTLTLRGDIKVVRDGKEKTYKYNDRYGNSYEVSKIDPDGTIYHLIAFDDGVVLRKITWK